MTAGVVATARRRLTPAAGSIVNAASVSAQAAPLVCAKPSGTADGDVLVSFQSNDWGTYAEMTEPGGWSLLTGLDRGSDNQHVKVWVKVASSEGADYSFGQGSADGCVTIVALRGVDTNTANWVYAAPAWAAQSASRVAPSVSGAADGAILLCHSMVEMEDQSGAAFAPPSGMTEQGDIQSTTWNAHSVASLLSPSNPSGTKTFTVSPSPGSTIGGIEFSVVIPAVG